MASEATGNGSGTGLPDGPQDQQSCLQLSTPADLPTRTRETHRVGRCILTSAHYTDIGLVDDDGNLIFGANSKQTRIQKRAKLAANARTSPSEDPPLTEEEEDLRLQMQLMGLPTAFTGTVEAVSGKSSSRSQEHEEMDWQQAYDWTHSAYYYYNEQTQETQWEPPAEGFCPAPHEWSHSFTSAVEEGADAAGRAAMGSGEAGTPEILRGTVLGRVDGQQRRETTGLLSRADLETSGTHTRFPSSDSESDDGAAAGGAAGAGGGPEGRADLGQGVSERDTQPMQAEKLTDSQVALEGHSDASPSRAKQGPEPMETAGSGGSAKGPSRRLLKKYWQQRYSLFHRFDRGIQMDEEAWYSVTPEVLADHQAQRCASGIAIDAFTGAGGNAIALGKTCSHVIAIDVSKQRVSFAKQNAAVYGVAGTVDFICGDFFRLAPHLAGDIVFLSPPWGGPEYVRSSTFHVSRDLGGMGLSLNELLRPAMGIVNRRRWPSPSATVAPGPRSDSRGVACFLPRNVDLAELSDTVEGFHGDEEIEVERNILNGILKGVTVYYGTYHDKVTQNTERYC